jgi:carboxy-terminal domain RNA polymerase II polypeptide A small phosphatase
VFFNRLLDETLIYANEYELNRPADFRVAQYYVYLRPGIYSFLQGVSALYRLGVWTSSSPAYASAICQVIFGDRVSLEFVWASDRCTPTRDFTFDTWSQTKRLSKLRRKGYQLEHVVVVDDSPEKHTKNYGNLVQVLPYEGDPSDRELELLLSYLEKLHEVENVRKVEKRGWRKGVATV